MLAEVGNARSVDLLRSYIDDPALGRSAIRYGSCRSLSWQFVGVGVPALVGLLGLVLVTASP
jgi:hypothetical protein